MARVAPADLSTNPELQAIVDASSQRLGFIPNSMRILAHRPEILLGFRQLTEAVNGPSATISRELKNLVSQMASRSSGCNYCISHTAHSAERSGISEEKEAALWDYASSPLFSDAERAALTVARGAGLSPSAVTDADFDELKKYYATEQIVEIVAVAALYGFYNRFNDTMATDLESSPMASRVKYQLPGARE